MQDAPAFDVSAAIARGKENPSWIALESNPEALNTFARGIGLPDTVAFTDCFGLEPDLLGFLPQPVYAIVLLFPFDNEAICNAKREQAEQLAGAEQPSVNCFWMEQSIGNACGTIAVVHSICNNLHRFKLQPGSLLERYAAIARNLSPADRGYLLGGWNEIKEVRESSFFLRFFSHPLPGPRGSGSQRVQSDQRSRSRGQHQQPFCRLFVCGQSHCRIRRR
jgi:hypothetical protein